MPRSVDEIMQYVRRMPPSCDLEPIPVTRKEFVSVRDWMAGQNRIKGLRGGLRDAAEVRIGYHRLQVL